MSPPSKSISTVFVKKSLKETDQLEEEVSDDALAELVAAISEPVETSKLTNDDPLDMDVSTPERKTRPDESNNDSPTSVIEN